MKEKLRGRGSNIISDSGQHIIQYMRALSIVNESTDRSLVWEIYIMRYLWARAVL
jgi:hypothetical protein